MRTNDMQHAEGMGMKTPESKKGFTLIELLITLAILIMVVALVYGIFINARHVQTAEEQLAGLSTQARGGLDQMVRELRMAGAHTAQDVTNACAAGGSVELINASTSTVEFEGDVDLSGKMERIRYFYDSANHVLNRWEYDITNTSGWNGTRCGPPPDSISDTSSYPYITSGAIQKSTVAYGITGMSFAFYNGSGSDITNSVNSQLSSVSAIGLTVTAASATNANVNRTVSVEIKLPNMNTSISGGGQTTGLVPQPVGWVHVVDPGVCGYLEVTWEPSPDPTVNQYKVYYKPQGFANWTGWQTVGTYSTSTGQGIAFFGPGLANGSTSYTAGVEAENPAGPSSMVNATSPTTISDPGTNLVAQVTGLSSTKDNLTNSVTLNWSAGSVVDSDTKTGYQAGTSGTWIPFPVQYAVLRSTSPTGPFTQVYSGITPITNTTQTDTLPTQCDTYYYEVQASDACGKTGTASAVYGNNPATMINGTVTPPSLFYAGGGAGNNKNNATAYFFGTAPNDNTNSDTLKIEYTTDSPSGGVCPAPANPPQPPPPSGSSGWSAVPSGGLSTLNPNPITLASGSPYTAAANYMSTGTCYNFAAYTQNSCGVSNALDSGYEVQGCEDCTTSKNGTNCYSSDDGMPNSCVYNWNNDTDPGPGGLVDPIRGLVCDQVRLYWKTENSSGQAPADCKAWGMGSGSFDYYPEQGYGGFIVYRSYNSGGGVEESPYQQLNTDPFTGPLQPFYWADTNYSENMSSCGQAETYRDQCSYRYHISSTDCAGNVVATTYPADLANQKAGQWFSPGVLNAPDTSTYPVDVRGPGKNKVLIYLQNTSNAALTWTGGIFSWLTDVSDPSYLEAVDFCNPEQPNMPNGTATGCTVRTKSCAQTGGVQPCWTSLWSASSFINAPSGTYLTFNSNPAIYNAPLLGDTSNNNGQPYKGRMLLTFDDSTGHPVEMDTPVNNQPQQISLVPYYTNPTTTVTANATCPPVGDATPYTFAVNTVAPPTMATPWQTPPVDGSGASCAAIVNASSPQTPPADNYKSYYYDPNWPGGQQCPDYDFLVPGSSQTVAVIANVTAASGRTIAACGTDTPSGVVLYWTATSDTATSPPDPQNNGVESITNPSNWNMDYMCNLSGTSCQSSSGTCQYENTAAGAGGAIPAQAGQRIWYYILAYDDLGNYGLVPVQYSNTFDTAYTYDQLDNNFHEIRLPSNGLSYSGSMMTFNDGFYLSRVEHAQFQDVADGSTNDSDLAISVTQNGTTIGPVNFSTVACPSGNTTCYQSESKSGAFSWSWGGFTTPSATDPIMVKVTAYPPSGESYPSWSCTWQWDGNGTTPTVSSSTGPDGNDDCPVAP